MAASAAKASAGSASLKRYQIVIYTTMFLGYGVYAYNRKSVSFAMPKLMEEGLDKRDAGLIISSQMTAYAISKFLGGVLSDRISSRLLFSVGLFVSGAATLLFAGANTIGAFTVLWFLNGFAQGCGWPACAKILRKWFEPERFGTFWSLLSASANVSGGVSPFVSAYLVLNYGWKTSLAVAGTVTLVVGTLSVACLVDTPEQVGLKSFGAPAGSTDGKKAGGKGAKQSTYKDLLQSPFLWLLAFCYMTVVCAKQSAVDWGQLYLIEDKGHSTYVGSAFTSSLESGGFVGGVLAGYLTDWALKRRATAQVADRSSPRMPIAMLFMVGVMSCLHLLCFFVHKESSQLWIVSLGFVMGACMYGPIAIIGVTATESAPTHLSGTAHAVVALSANIGAIFAGLPFSMLAKTYSWRAVFLFTEFLCAGASLLMLVTSKTEARIGHKKQD